MKPALTRIFSILISVAIIGAIIFLRLQISKDFDYQNTNFSFFWLAGRMVLDGENPYDQTQYLAGHDANGMNWRPNKIFPYPLPLALLCIPLGLFSMGDAFLVWQSFSLLVTAVTIYYLLSHWKNPTHDRLLIPIFFFMVFFGPLFLSVRIGSIGTFALLFLLATTILFDQGMSFPAGFILALTMLKPPQGLPIIFLFGIWLLAKRDWKALIGIALGGAAILIIGLIQDADWLTKFTTASDAVINRTQGIHSNVWAFAYLTCKGAAPCSTLLGGTLSLLLLGLGGSFLWKNHAKLSVWEAMNIILPIGFVSTIYLWVYDQLPFIIPLVWIIGTLVKLSKNYIYAFLLMIVIDVYSFYTLRVLALTDRDLWSLGTTIFILGGVIILQKLKPPLENTSPLLQS